MENEQRRIGFVILAWNSQKVLPACLDSIFALRDFETCTVVINNGSTDGTGDYLKTIRPTERHALQIISLERDHGTTVTRNAGLRLLRRQQVDYYCVLGSDTVVNDRALTILADTLDGDETIGLVGPQLITSEGVAQDSGRRFPCALEKLCKAVPLKAVRRMGEEMEQLPGRTTDGTPYPADYIVSTCWLFKPAVLERAGYLDENIYRSPEDAEYGIRVWKAGFRCVVCPEAQIIHERQCLSRQRLVDGTEWKQLKGMAYMFRKHGYCLRTDALWEQIRARQNHDRRSDIE